MVGIKFRSLKVVSQWFYIYGKPGILEQLGTALGFYKTCTLTIACLSIIIKIPQME